MSISGLISSPAVVVELAGFRSSGKAAKQVSTSCEAQLLSMRRHLSYQASVEIDSLEDIKAQYGESTRRYFVKQVRALLDKEFGNLRVHRYRGLYVIRHRSVEGLISSLLRVQFHAHQFELPIMNRHGEPSDAKPITLTWGVGRTNSEAEVERLRRRRQKMKR